MAKPPRSPSAGRRSVGRPPLAPEVHVGRVAAYCARYGVASRDGLPPFPAGQRETPQHREWLKLYKAHQRLARRLPPDGDRGPAADAMAGPDGVNPAARRACDLCGRSLGADRMRFELPGRAGRKAAPAATAPDRLVHPGCAELLRLALEAGPDAVSRLASLLWPDGAAAVPALRAESRG